MLKGLPKQFKIYDKVFALVGIIILSIVLLWFLSPYVRTLSYRLPVRRGIRDPLQRAARQGDMDAIKIFLQQGTNFHGCSWAANTALHVAAINGHVKAVEMLLSSGAYIDAQDCRTDHTPLHYVIEEGRREVAELLIAKGADVNARAKNNETPLHCVATSYDEGCLHKSSRFYSLNQNGVQQLQDVSYVIQERIAIAEMLLANGADIDAQDFEGTTPLQTAVDSGYIAIVEFLLQQGADVNAKASKTSSTSLDIAKASCHPQKEKIIELLQRYGAKESSATN